MNKLKAALTFLLSGLGIFGVNQYYKPKNIKELLKWRGVNLAEGNSVWESMFFEYQDELKLKEIKDSKELWKWCSEKFKLTNLWDEQSFEEAKKYCSDSAISIMGRIIREGEESKVIKNPIEAQINYVVSGNSGEILKLIGFNEVEKNNTSEVAKKLLVWCEKQKKEKVASLNNLAIFSEFKKRCYSLGVKNIKDLLNKQKLKVMKDIPSYLQRFKEELRNSPQFLEEIKKIKEDQKNGNKALFEFWARQEARKQTPYGKDENFFELVQYYRTWCNQQFEKNLFEEGVFPNLYAKVKYRCTEKIN